MSEPVRVPLRQLTAGEPVQITVDGQPVCVARVGDDVFAVHDECSHASIPLSDGGLQGRQIVCPWHGAMFDLKTGKATCGPAVDAIRCYAVRIEGEHAVIEK